MPFNSVSEKKIYINNYFISQLIKIYSQKLPEPNSYLQASQNTSLMSPLVTLIISGNGKHKCGELYKSASILFCCFYLSIGFIAAEAHPNWIKTTIKLQTKTNGSQRNADKTGNYENFYRLPACTSPQFAVTSLTAYKFLFC